VIAVEYVDQKLRIDDPVGAFAVHGCNGLWGTLAVGLFDYKDGLFYGGGAHLLGVQVLGIVTIAAYTIVTMSLVFLALKKTVGLRVSAEEEILGLDLTEHALASAYADFLPIEATSIGGENTETIDVTDLRKKELPTILPEAKTPERRFTKITIICKEDRFAVLKDAMNQIDVTGMTVTHVMGCGTQKGKTGQYRGVKMNMNLLPQLQVDIVVSTVAPELVVAAAKKALYTGEYGDGKIFLYDVENVVRIRTHETGMAALDNTKVQK
jgi:Amt family ammonium transporter